MYTPVKGSTRKLSKCKFNKFGVALKSFHCNVCVEDIFYDSDGKELDAIRSHNNRSVKHKRNLALSLNLAVVIVSNGEVDERKCEIKDVIFDNFLIEETRYSFNFMHVSRISQVTVLAFH